MVDKLGGMTKRGGSDEQRRARGEQTRRALVSAGRTLFVEPGYFAVSIADIVDHAGVGSRGAFYHHFADKVALFRAVFAEVEQDLVLRAIAAPPSGDRWDRLSQGLHGCLDAALDPEVQRIVLIDGPVVLGWRRLRDIEDAGSISMVEEALRRAISEGTIDEQPVRELAHMLLAAAEEAALMVAHSTDPASAKRTAGAVLDRFLRSLAPQDLPARTRGHR